MEENTNPAAAPKKSRGKILGAVGVLVLCGLGYFGYNWYTDQRNYVTTENAKVSGDIINVSSKIPGKVVDIKIQTGSKVHKGDVLFSLDKDQLQGQVSQAQAALDVAKAQLTKLTGGARTEEVAGAQAGVDSAQAAYNGSLTGKDNLTNALAEAQANYQKVSDQISAFYKKLGGLSGLTVTDPASANQALIMLNQKGAANGGLTDAQYTVQSQTLQSLLASQGQLQAQIDQLQGQIKTTNAQISAAQAGLNGAKSKLQMVNSGASDKDVAIVEAQVKAAQATFDLAKLNLSYADVPAPVDGTVVQTNVHLGDNIAPGQAAISLVDLSKLQVTAYVLENDLERVQIGQSAKLTLDAFPGQTFEGSVKELGLATASTFNLFGGDNATGNFTKVSQRIPVKIDFNTAGSQIIPGMSVTAKIKVTP